LPGLEIATAWPTLEAGGDIRLGEWCAARPDRRLVIVDTLQKVRGVTSDRVNPYGGDYDTVGRLKTVADEHGVCILVLHNDRKADADDSVDRVSGPHGIAGAADAVLVISRARNTSEATLDITGRDVEEARHALAFDALAASWRLLDIPADE